jgi:putative membrane protein
VVLAEKFAGHELVGTQKDVATDAIHWGFGALTGAAYGALVEYYPAATAKDGATFGIALSSLTHGTVLPAMGLGAKPEEQTARERTSEMATHVVYGVVTETVRRVVRKMLG